jgi:hypothetical protein
MDESIRESIYVSIDPAIIIIPSVAAGRAARVA